MLAPSLDATKTNKAKAGGPDHAAGKKKTHRPPTDATAARESLADDYDDGDRLCCIICLGTVEDAMQTGCCGQPVCRECIDLAMAPDRNPNNACPSCRNCDGEYNAPVRDPHNERMAANDIVFAGDRRVCSLCRELVFNAIQTGCCGTSCCRGCILRALDPRLNPSNSCPFCDSACACCGNTIGPLRDPHNERMAANTVRTCPHGCGISAKRDALAAHVRVCKTPLAEALAKLAAVREAREARNDFPLLGPLRQSATGLLLWSFAAASPVSDARAALRRRLQAKGVYAHALPCYGNGGTTRSDERRRGDDEGFAVSEHQGGDGAISVCVTLSHTHASAPAAGWYIMMFTCTGGTSVQHVVPATGQSVNVVYDLAAEHLKDPRVIFAARTHLALGLDADEAAAIAGVATPESDAADNERMAANTDRTCPHGCGFSAKRDALAAHGNMCEAPIKEVLADLAAVDDARGGLRPPLNNNVPALRAVPFFATRLLMWSFAAASSADARAKLKRHLQAKGVYAHSLRAAASDLPDHLADWGHTTRFKVRQDKSDDRTVSVSVSVGHPDGTAPAADWWFEAFSAAGATSVKRVTVPAMGQTVPFECSFAAEDFQGPVAIFAGRSRAALGIHDADAGS